MSTQPPNHSPIPLYLNHPFRNVRLLELPDDLLEIVTSGSNGSNGDTLWFKSSPAQPTEEGKEAGEGNLHLCSDERVWLVKQVSTSNSVYVTKSHSGMVADTAGEDFDMIDGHGEENGYDKPASGQGITAFAKPGNVLELHAVPSRNYDAMALDQLNRLVPTVYHAEDLNIAAAKSGYSMLQLYEHIPAPKNSITKMFAQMCVFELPWSPQRRDTEGAADTEDTHDNSISDSKIQAYIPGSTLLLETWKKIVEAATISDRRIAADIEADLLLDGSSDVDAMTDGDANGLYKAVAKQLFGESGYFAAHGLTTQAETIDQKHTINEMELARWVGNLILKVESMRASGSQVEKVAFESMWEDAVPAAWVKFCSVEVLGSACQVKTDEAEDTVSWREFTNGACTDRDGIATPATSKNKQSTTTTSTTSKGKRKWHEKFAGQRSTKK